MIKYFWAPGAEFWGQIHTWYVFHRRGSSPNLSSLFLFSVWLFPFVSPFQRMCMSCLSYLVLWHGIALRTAVLTAYHYVATLYLCGVALIPHINFCIASRIKESAWTLVVLGFDGRKNGLMWRTHTKHQYRLFRVLRGVFRELSITGFRFSVLFVSFLEYPIFFLYLIEGTEYHSFFFCQNWGQR